jgi:hypothetical protein
LNRRHEDFQSSKEPCKTFIYQCFRGLANILAQLFPKIFQFINLASELPNLLLKLLGSRNGAATSWAKDCAAERVL